jgi:hypothetical protein
MNSILNNSNNTKEVAKKILNNLDYIIERESHEQVLYNKGFLAKRKIRIPRHIKILISNLEYPISYDEMYNILFLDKSTIKKAISTIIDIYNNIENNKERSYIFVPQTFQLFSGNPTLKEILIAIPTKPSIRSEKELSYEDIIKNLIKNYIKFIILHGLLLSTENIRKLKLPKEMKEYIIYVLAIISYYKTFSTKLGISSIGIYISLYNTIGCRNILESIPSLINKDPFTAGACTGYHILAEYGLHRINLKNIYEELVKDPYHFLENILKNTNKNIL